MRSVIGILVLCASFALGCQGQRASDIVDRGTVQNHKYSNKYFGFQVTLNPDWSVASQAEQEAAKKVGKQLLADNQQEAERLFKAADVTSLTLLQVLKHPFGTATANPNFTITCDNLRRSGITDASKYLDQVRQSLEGLSGQIQFRFEAGEAKVEKLGNTEFHRLDGSAEFSGGPLGGVSFKTKFYGLVRNQFGLIIGTMYESDEDWAAIKAMLDTFDTK